MCCGCTNPNGCCDHSKGKSTCRHPVFTHGATQCSACKATNKLHRAAQLRQARGIGSSVQPEGGGAIGGGGEGDGSGGSGPLPLGPPTTSTPPPSLPPAATPPPSSIPVLAQVVAPVVIATVPAAEAAVDPQPRSVLEHRCLICLDRFIREESPQDPLILTGCGHSFCYNCTHELFDRRGEKCPQCAKPCRWRDAIPNYELARLLRD